MEKKKMLSFTQTDSMSLGGDALEFGDKLSFKD